MIVIQRPAALQNTPTLAVSSELPLLKATHMASHIVFSLAAQRKLRQRMARQIAGDETALDARLRDIQDKLGRMFPQAPTTLLQDVYRSFRDREGELVLLVELPDSGDDAGVFVVKLGTEQRLDEELQKSRSCLPPCRRHDLVLMTIQPKYACGDSGPLIGLVYSDAEQLIGVDETLPLETALLDAARLGVPTPASVGDVLFQLYERLGLLFFDSSYVDDPREQGYRFQLSRFDKRLPENLAAWEAAHGPVFECRAQATTFTEFEPLSRAFRDPVSFLQFVGRMTAQQPSAAATLVPRILRGQGHGDLHGRNVLVGRVEDRVLWPAVFDYGDMGPDNVVGWDFVKLETEFKIRAYPRVFANAAAIASFVPEVVSFERELCERTELARNACRWPLEPAADTPRERLLWLLLRLRQLADCHLSTRRNRSRDWLAEYYFLLTVYGLNSARFANLTPLEVLGAYLSAGTACARYLYDREGALAELGVLGDADGRSPVPCWSHHGELEAIRRLWRNKHQPADLEAARQRLALLRREFPYVLAVGHELVLVLEQLGEWQAAVDLLNDLERQFKSLDEETLCRWGKLYKTRGAAAAAQGRFSEAIHNFAEARKQYARAYEIQRGYYPRINELTLGFLQAALYQDDKRPAEALRLLKEVQLAAAEMLATTAIWQHRNHDDDVWVLATQGEAHLLANNWPTATTRYQDALAAARGRQFYADCMRDQLQLLLSACHRLGIRPEGPLAEPDRFFSANGQTTL